MSLAEPPDLVICTTCRAGLPIVQGEPPLGEMLHTTLARAITDSDASVRLRSVGCLANCARGCSGVITMPGKWTYLLGFLAPALAGDLITYAATYAASANGAVLPSQRPASLRNVVIGRVPPMEFTS